MSSEGIFHLNYQNCGRKPFNGEKQCLLPTSLLSWEAVSLLGYFINVWLHYLVLTKLFRGMVNPEGDGTRDTRWLTKYEEIENLSNDSLNIHTKEKLSVAILT